MIDNRIAYSMHSMLTSCMCSHNHAVHVQTDLGSDVEADIATDHDHVTNALIQTFKLVWPVTRNLLVTRVCSISVHNSYIYGILCYVIMVLLYQKHQIHELRCEWFN